MQRLFSAQIWTEHTDLLKPNQPMQFISNGVEKIYVYITEMQLSLALQPWPHVPVCLNHNAL